MPYLFHDEILDYKTNSSGPFCQRSSRELDLYDAGSWFSNQYIGENILRLSSFLELVIKYNLGVNLEIKPSEDFEEETATVVCDFINQHWPSNSPILISSFSNEVMSIVASKLPKTPKGYLTEKVDENWEKHILDTDYASIHLNHKTITNSKVELIKAKGYKILCYTVNEPLIANKLFELGIDSVFTDYPQRISQRLI